MEETPRGIESNLLENFFTSEEIKALRALPDTDAGINEIVRRFAQKGITSQPDIASAMGELSPKRTLEEASSLLAAVMRRVTR